MSKDLSEFYTDDEVESIKREARDMAELLDDEAEYDSYLEWKYDQAKAADDRNHAALAAELRGLPGFD